MVDFLYLFYNVLIHFSQLFARSCDQLTTRNYLHGIHFSSSQITDTHGRSRRALSSRMKISFFRLDFSCSCYSFFLRFRLPYTSFLTLASTYRETEKEAQEEQNKSERNYLAHSVYSHFTAGPNNVNTHALT